MDFYLRMDRRPASAPSQAVLCHIASSPVATRTVPPALVGGDCAQAKRETEDRAVAPAARCKNFRRRSFMNAPGVLAEHGAWMLEMRMLRAERPADGISATGKYWTSASPGSFHIRRYPTPYTRNGPDVASSNRTYRVDLTTSVPWSRPEMANRRSKQRFDPLMRMVCPSATAGWA